MTLWLLFSAALYLGERGSDATTITSYGKALYWGVAAFSTAGIADTPVGAISEIIGGIWIILGSMLFFGTIVATITAYFMRPLQRPAKQIVDTIDMPIRLTQVDSRCSTNRRPTLARGGDGRGYNAVICTAPRR